AIELGLADQYGNVDYVAREVIKAEEIVDYTRKDNVAEKLARKFGAGIGDASIRALLTTPAIR
ncbi:MAG: S49 family peptidase, partial [Gammaproteobacteria bacterium]|nr:S49 family peptidase [Gammaproteobacteria bacterium]